METFAPFFVLQFFVIEICRYFANKYWPNAFIGKTNESNMITSILFPRYANNYGSSLFLLAMRIMIGSLFLAHGLEKVLNFAVFSANFPDPLGIGSNASLILTIFAELFCSIAFIFGFLYRLVMIPMLISVSVAFFLVHHADMSQGELAFIYLLIFILMYISGPGRFSVDAIFGKMLRNRDNK